MKVLRMVVFMFLMALSNSAKAIEFKPYIGGDALLQWRQMDFTKNYGHNLFPKISPQLNFYTGILMNDAFSIEAGYEYTNSHTKHVTLREEDAFLGNILGPIISPVLFKTKFVIEGPHINTLLFYPLITEMKVFAGIGVSFLRATFKTRTLQYCNPPIQRNRLRTLSQFKSVLRLSTGAMYMFTENFGGRLTIGWENTKKICALPIDGYAPQAKSKVKPKDSIIYGVGIFTMF